ncbi:MAG: AMP-binding protein [Candidatus Binatia bacterium]|nr:AMP-binding protein [Candidatus Binatia bacterium]
MGVELITELIARRAREQGAQTFIYHEGQRCSYAEFHALTNRFANALLALGIDKGDRVTLAMGNSVEYLVAAFGILKAGAVLHPVNPALGSRELSYLLQHAEPKLVVTNSETVEKIPRGELQVPAGLRWVSFGGGPDVLALDRLLAEASGETVPVELLPDDSSTLLYTSGTTGHPKGVLFRHSSTGAAGQHFVHVLGIQRDDTVLAVTPLFHGNAWGAVVTALQAGAAVAFPKMFSASQFWPLVHEVGATVLYTLGTILAILLAQPSSELERTSRLRVILGLGSAPLREQIRLRFGVTQVVECFGSTDAGVVTIEPPGSSPRPGSCGPPVPGVQIRIVDDEGRELSPRQTGEIVVRSPHCLAEYFRDPEQTRAALRDGWFFTGDLGYLDEDGWLYFVDRKRDVIRRGGENVSSAYVEKILREHPAVAEVAVIGVPDPVLGQEIKAFVVPSREVTEEELRVFAAARLAKFQVPKYWEFRTSLPKTPTQRIEKYKLRAESGPGGPLIG